MAFNTKIILSDRKVVQDTTHTLTLNGTTEVYNGNGIIKYNENPDFTGSTEYNNSTVLVTKGYVDTKVNIAMGGGVLDGENGISKNGNNLSLGGALLRNTTIDGDSTYNLELKDLNEFEVSVDGASIILSDNSGLRYAGNYASNYTNRSLVDKEYVDAVSLGITPKTSVRVATTANITLSGVQTIDGVTLVAEDRVLVKNQTDNTENGIYVVKSGSWERSSDFDFSPESETRKGDLIPVLEGTINENSVWVISVFSGSGNAIEFTKFSQLVGVTDGNGISINTVGGNSSISVDLDSAYSGLSVDSNGLKIASSIAGVGLDYTNGVLDVKADSGGLTGNAIPVKIDGSGNLCIDDDTIPHQDVPVTGATNGLGLSGKDVILGGTLTQNTTIAGDNRTLTINGLSSLTLSATNVTIGGATTLSNVDSGSAGTDSLLVRDGSGAIKQIGYDNILNNRNGIRSVNTATTLTVTDNIILVDDGATITLPTSLDASYNGLTFKIKDISGDAFDNPISILGTIDGNVNGEINTDYGALELVYHGGEWFTLAFIN